MNKTKCVLCNKEGYIWESKLIDIKSEPRCEKHFLMLLCEMWRIKAK